jgi:RNA polymerase sigma factor (sigma-70 family)
MGQSRAESQTDGHLLYRFVHEQDQTAFTALVQRHGPMVLGLCRRILQDNHDAEDVFQATFLVLVRKARSLKREGSLKNWLYTVAYHLALKTRKQTAIRRVQEKQVIDMPELTRESSGFWAELRPALDSELARLPSKYREPIMLCYLEGKTNEEAACELGWPVGTVKIRLMRAREVLRTRLTRRGLALSAALLAPNLADVALAAVPDALLESTSEAAKLFASGKTIIAGAVAARSIVLAQGALQSMFMRKVQIVVVLLFIVGLVGAGSGILMGSGSDVPTQMPVARENEIPNDLLPVPVEDPSKDNDKAQSEKQIKLLHQKLAQPVNLDRGIPPGSLLRDALEFLADRYDMALIIDTKAFEAIGILDVMERPVSLPKMVGVNMATVLRMLLGQIQSEQQHGAYAIRKDHIAIITTAQFFSADRLTREERRWLPTVSADFDRAPVDVALREVMDQTGTCVVLDAAETDKGRKVVTARFAQTPVDTAVRLLANMADLQTVAIDNVLYVTNVDKAKHLQAEQDAREIKQRQAEKEAREAKERQAEEESAKKKVLQEKTKSPPK